MNYPLATTSWDNDEYRAMRRVIDSGHFTMGPEVAAFERAFAAFHGTRHAVMVNSGSSANLLMIAALFFRRERPLQRGDEVIVPAVSWSTTFTPLQQHGLVPVFVDVDPDTLNIDVSRVGAAVTERTRAILAVNLLGNPAQLDRLASLAADHDLLLLEDNCESLGARLGGRLTGTWGIAGSFSSFFSHHISTMEGGVVVTDDEELCHIMLSLRAHGWTRQLPEENRVATKTGDSFYESFRFVLPGYNLRPLELSGAIGQEQLRKLPVFVEGRRRNARHFVELFAGDPRFRVQKETGESSWFGFSLVVTDDAIDRDTVVSALEGAAIDVRPIVAGNFLRNPVIAYFDHRVPAPLAASDEIHDRGFFVGNGHNDLRREIDYLHETLSAIC